MLFNRKFNRFPAVGAIFLLSIFVIWSSTWGDPVNAISLAQATVTAVSPTETAESACPVLTEAVTAPTLDLVWYTGGTPDELVGGNVDGFNTGWMGVDFEGNVYTVIGGESASVIKKFDTDGNFVMSFEVDVSRGTGIDVDSEGNIFINDFANAQVLKFDSAGTFLMQWATEPPTGPTGIAVDTEGHVIVANHRTHEHYVQKFDNDGQLLLEWGSDGEGDGQFTGGSRKGPEGIAAGANGKIYVTDTNNNRIQVFDSEGNFLVAMGTYGAKGEGKFDRPFGVATDGEENIYVVDQHFIQKFDEDGVFLTQWDVTEGELDSGGYYLTMAVDTPGNIYWLGLREIYVTTTEKNEVMMVLKKFRQC